MDIKFKYNSRMVAAKDIKKGMTVLVYDEEYKVTEVSEKHGEYTIWFDSGERLDFKPSEKLEVK